MVVWFCSALLGCVTRRGGVIHGKFVMELMEGKVSGLIAVKVVSWYQDSTPDIKVSG